METVWRMCWPKNRYMRDAVFRPSLCAHARALVGNMIVEGTSSSYQLQFKTKNPERIPFRARSLQSHNSIRRANAKKRKGSRLLTTCYVTDVLPNARNAASIFRYTQSGTYVYVFGHSAGIGNGETARFSNLLLLFHFHLIRWTHFVRTSFAN